nr:hypothetical protein [Tanacetum cinerariifolium]
YREYLAKVTHHRKYLAGETGGVQNPPAPKPIQPARKPKAPTRPSILIPVRSAQPAPTSAPAKPQEKKRKQTIETSDKPPKEKKSKHGWEESEKIVLEAEEGGQDEGRAVPDPDAQAEDQTGSDAGAQAEGQAGSNPDETSEARLDQTLMKPLKARLDQTLVMLKLKYNLFQVLWFTLDQTKLDEGFTATIYPNVQENLKLAVEESVLLEEPASSSGTLSSLQHLSRDFSFGDQFFSDKHSDANKNAETEVESMNISNLKQPQHNNNHNVTTTTSSTTKHDRGHDGEAYCTQEKEKESRVTKNTTWSPSHQPPLPPPPAGPSGALGAPRASGSAQMPTSPPPPSSTNQESPSKGSAAPSPSKTATSAEYQSWTTSDIRLRSFISLTPADLEMDEDMAPDEQAQSSDDKDIGSAHIPMVNLRQGWWKPFEEERPTTSKPACKGRRRALSISKMKAAYYHDAGLEQMVPD